jgi:hypothetical protein
MLSSIMTSRALIGVVAVAAAVATAGCQSTAPAERLAAGDEAISFFGAGRDRLDFDRLRPIRFAPGSWEPGEEEADRLGEVAGAMAGGARVFLVGVGDVEVPSEHGRQQALARALTVRRRLIGRGASPDQILVSGLAATEAEGLAGLDAPGPRVACAVIR